MKSDKELEKLIEPIIKIYNDIEIELLRKIASHFDIYENVGVSRSLEWWLKKLNEFGTLNKQAVEVISEYSNMTTISITEMLKEAGYANVDKEILNKAYLNNAIKVNPVNILNSPTMKSVIDNSFKELNETLKLINTKALESTKKAYMDVLNKAYLEVSSGIYDYNTSIKNTLLEMADKGITGATYMQSNGTIRNYSIEGVIRRDVMTAVIQTANKGTETLCNELGAEYVEVSSHLGARTGDGIHPHSDHGHWQGKIYKLNGFDDKYDNFYTQTGYGDILGLGGVNCRHKFWAFFPGISESSQTQYNEEENKKAYELSKKQRYLERQVRFEKKRIALAEETKDDELLKKSNKNLIVKQKRLNDFCVENDLVRDKNREHVINNVNNLDVTKKWLNEATPNSHKIKDMNYFEYHDTKYNVDGKNVVLDYSDKEKDVAEWLENTFGGEIYMVPRINNPSGISTADYFFKNEYWDLKTITGNGKHTLDTAIKKKKSQSSNFLFDISDSKMSNKEIVRQLKLIFKSRDRQWINKIIVKRNTNVIVIYEHKKRD